MKNNKFITIHQKQSSCFRLVESLLQFAVMVGLFRRQIVAVILLSFFVNGSAGTKQLDLFHYM